MRGAGDRRESLIMIAYVCCMVFAFALSDRGNLGGEGTPGAELAEASAYVAASVDGETCEPLRIALTFDDGPSAVFTPKLLDGLKERGVKATFFLIGENAERYPDVVRRMDAEGHLIGNHTYHHVQLTGVPEQEAVAEVAETSRVIAGITGKEPVYMRPPFGAWQRGLERELAVIPVLWTIDPLDWTTENTDEVVNKVVTEAKENDIILLHDCYESSVEAALRIVDLLQKEGFEFVTADALIAD